MSLTAVLTYARGILSRVPWEDEIRMDWSLSGFDSRNESDDSRGSGDA
jgi:hypothetical protein